MKAARSTIMETLEAGMMVSVSLFGKNAGMGRITKVNHGMAWVLLFQDMKEHNLHESCLKRVKYSGKTAKNVLKSLTEILVK